jgi:predicted PurR-regulated permease PerM
MITSAEEAAPSVMVPPMEDPPSSVSAVALPATATEASSIHFPVNARGVCLVLLATIAFIFALQLGQKFFIPLVFSILVSYTLTPVVAQLVRIRIPRVVAISVVMLSLLFGAGAVINSLHTEFQSILSRLPDAAHQLSQAIAKAQDGQPGTMQKMQTAANEIERATSEASGGRTPVRQVAARPAFKVQEWLWAGSMGAAGFVGQATMVIFLIFFLLLSGDSFKRKLVKITGPSLSSKKITVNILDDINSSIQSYMFMLLVTNVLLAGLLWIVFRWIGLENAGAWAVAAGCLHIIPYFGQLIIAVATGFTAFLQFGSLSKMFLVSGSSLLVAMLVGTFITTWMTGKIAKMNAAAVFIGLLFFGWLWGVWGLLLGVPIIVMVRVISEHVDGMQSVAELLSE